MSPDPYDPNEGEITTRYVDDYQLPLHDKQSINEIKKKIKSQGYKKLDRIKRHQEFLEDMTNRLRLILQKEKRAGRVNWELERQIEEIKTLYFDLERVRKEKVKNR